MVSIGLQQRPQILARVAQSCCTIFASTGASFVAVCWREERLLARKYRCKWATFLSQSHYGREYVHEASCDGCPSCNAVFTCHPWWNTSLAVAKVFHLEDCEEHHLYLVRVHCVTPLRRWRHSGRLFTRMAVMRKNAAIAEEAPVWLDFQITRAALPMASRSVVAISPAGIR